MAETDRKFVRHSIVIRARNSCKKRSQTVSFGLFVGGCVSNSVGVALNGYCGEYSHMLEIYREISNKFRRMQCQLPSPLSGRLATFGRT